MAHHRDEPLESYQQAQDLLVQSVKRGHVFRRLAHNTMLLPTAHHEYNAVIQERLARLGYATECPPEQTTVDLLHGVPISVVLHKTPILTYLPDETVIVYLAGWYTQVSMDRINRLLPKRVLRVHADNGVLWMRQQTDALVPGLWGPAPDWRDLGPFVEGLRLSLGDGAPTQDSLALLDQARERQCENLARERLIDRYVAKVARTDMTHLEFDEAVNPPQGCVQCLEGLWELDGATGVAHILRHLSALEVRTALIERAILVMRVESRMGAGARQHSRTLLRAYLRDTLCVGPVMTATYRRRPDHVPGLLPVASLGFTNGH